MLSIVALSRYAGLRCPSESLALRWTDIYWDRGRFRVTAPKTERYGKGERVPPLFPELRYELDALFKLVAPGMKCPADSYVIQQYRQADSNLRTTFDKILERAGVTRFAKPFNNLRSSARTAMERSGRYPNHVLNDWFGHSGAIAETYYLQTTEDDYAEALRETAASESHSVGTSVGTSAREQDPSLEISAKEKPHKTGALITVDGFGVSHQYTRRDSNPQPSVPKTDALSS